MPEVSIIVPIYNAQEYLSRCIDSILNQSFKDFQLILVDDGSTDDSGLICDEYAQKDDRVNVLHKKNSGVSAARNTGIDSALGRYIMFVDSDDYIHSQMLQDMLGRFSESADMVVASIKMVTKDSECDYRMKDSVYSARKLLEDYCLEKFPHICLCGPWCKLYKKEIIDAFGIRFDTNLSLGEDTSFNMQYLSCIDSVSAISDIHYFYMRDNEESLFSKFRDNCYSDSKKAHEIILKTAGDLGCSSKAIESINCLYVKRLVANLVKAIITADAKSCFVYMKKISKDELFNDKLYVFGKGSLQYYVAKAIQKKLYYLVYVLMLIRYRRLRKQV